MPGLTGECTNGQHGACADRECRCRCHPWTQQVTPNPSSTPVAASQKMCPKCSRRTALTENFCREDGTPLVVGVGCKRCGLPLLGTDKYCAYCGVPRTWEPPPVETPNASLEVGKEVNVQ